MKPPRSFYGRSALEVAPELLNKVLVAGDRSGRIVEVEAYAGADDPASHGFGGPTPRTEVMFGPAGHLYVYFTYGMHWCANVVTGEDGACGAVLIRALEPMRGAEAMFTARAKAKKATDLCSGPAKLCQALAIDGDHDGIDLLSPSAAVSVLDDGTPPPDHPVIGTRIGISKAIDFPWRFHVEGNPHVSRPR